MCIIEGLYVCIGTWLFESESGWEESVRLWTYVAIFTGRVCSSEVLGWFPSVYLFCLSYLLIIYCVYITNNELYKEKQIWTVWWAVIDRKLFCLFISFDSSVIPFIIYISHFETTHLIANIIPPYLFLSRYLSVYLF